MDGLDELLAPLALVDGLDELLARLVLVDGVLVVICVEFIAAKSQWEERIEFIHACMISRQFIKTNLQLSYIRIYVTVVLPHVAMQDGYE